MAMTAVTMTAVTSSFVSPLLTVTCLAWLGGWEAGGQPALCRGGDSHTHNFSKYSWRGQRPDIHFGKEAQSRHVGVHTTDVDVEYVQVGITTVIDEVTGVAVESSVHGSGLPC